MSERTPNDIELLITRHLDGELSSGDIASLQSWLRADPANADLFARRAIDHQRLHELTAVETLVLVSDGLDDADPLPDAAEGADDEEMLGALQALGLGQEDAMPVDITERVKREAARDRRAARQTAVQGGGSAGGWVIPAPLVWLGIAATVGLVAWLGWSVTGTNPIDTPTQPMTADNTAPSLPQDAGVVVAQITETVDAHWVGSPQPDGLRAGTTLTLASGFAQVGFGEHGSVLVEGPATFEVVDSGTLRLIDGRLVAQATDATEALSLRVGDTVLQGRDAEFGVASYSRHQASTVVYSGSIGVSEATAAPQATADRIGPGRAATLSTRLGTVTHESSATTADAAGYSRSIEGVRLRPFRHSASVQFLSDPPSSLCVGELVDSRRVRLILESRSNTIDADVLLTLQRDVAPTLGTFPFGQDVDSYLIHMDPTGGAEEGPVVLTGSVTFERPIQAVMGGPRDLVTTDRLFGSPLIKYPRSSRTAGGPAGDLTWGIELGTDTVSLSADRRTLHFRIQASSAIDQLRILVLSEGHN